jgi:hypothetical protein
VQSDKQLPRITDIFDLAHCLVFSKLEKTRFCMLQLFPSAGEEEDVLWWLSYKELISTTGPWFRSLLEDGREGDRSFRNVVFSSF